MMEPRTTFKIGDRVRADGWPAGVGKPAREGKVVRLPGNDHGYTMCYLVKFTSSANYLLAAEIEHVDAVTRLGELT